MFLSNEKINYNNYLDDVVNSLSLRQDLLKTLECNTDSQFKKINLIEKEIQNLNNASQILKETLKVFSGFKNKQQKCVR